MHSRVQQFRNKFNKLKCEFGYLHIAACCEDELNKILLPLFDRRSLLNTNPTQTLCNDIDEKLCQLERIIKFYEEWREIEKKIEKTENSPNYLFDAIKDYPAKNMTLEQYQNVMNDKKLKYEEQYERLLAKQALTLQNQVEPFNNNTGEKVLNESPSSSMSYNVKDDQLGKDINTQLEKIRLISEEHISSWSPDYKKLLVMIGKYNTLIDQFKNNIATPININEFNEVKKTLTIYHQKVLELFKLLNDLNDKQDNLAKFTPKLSELFISVKNKFQIDLLTGQYWGRVTNAGRALVAMNSNLANLDHCVVYFDYENKQLNEFINYIPSINKFIAELKAARELLTKVGKAENITLTQQHHNNQKNTNDIWAQLNKILSQIDQHNVNQIVKYIAGEIDQCDVNKLSDDIRKMDPFLVDLKEKRDKCEKEYDTCEKEYNGLCKKQVALSTINNLYKKLLDYTGKPLDTTLISEPTTPFEPISKQNYQYYIDEIPKKQANCNALNQQIVEQKNQYNQLFTNSQLPFFNQLVEQLLKQQNELQNEQKKMMARFYLMNKIRSTTNLLSISS